jgi:hypothetical protein
LPGGDAGDYYERESGCITPFNRVAQLHNRALNRMLCELRRAHPRTSIHYGDLYHPVTAIVSSPREHGAHLMLVNIPPLLSFSHYFFLAKGFGGMPLAACCGGGGGPYNFNFTFFCGTPLGSACADPSGSVSWDGIHYTEAANKFVAHAMLKGL